MSGYADTSFLVSLYTPDSNSAEAAALFLKRDDLVFITPFGEAEFANTIELRVFRKEVSPTQAERSLRDFERDLNAGTFLSRRAVPAGSYGQALPLSRQHTRQIGARCMDVIHVAIAMGLGSGVFYTFDRDQAKLAKRAGLTVRPGR